MDAVITIFLLIYLLTLLVSATDLVPLSVAALSGALLTAWFGIQYGVFTYEEALGFIDFRLLGLVIGTMIVVEVAERSGLFRVMALYAIKLSGGSPRKLFVFLCITSAAVSMFLSDSTAMLLMAAATVTITKLLNYDPTPYFLASTIMINLGGTSTLIGSVSNMIIGVEAGMTFTDFVTYLALKIRDFQCYLSMVLYNFKFSPITCIPDVHRFYATAVNTLSLAPRNTVLLLSHRCSHA